MTDSTSSTSLSQPLYGATFGQALSRFFKKYATVAGRASRSEYWWVALGLFLVSLVFSLLFSLTGGYDTAATGTLSGGAVAIAIIWGIWGLAVIIPHISLSVRRLHDANLSGFLYLLILIPGLGGLILLILVLLPSKPEGARFDA